MVFGAGVGDAAMTGVGVVGGVGSAGTGVGTGTGARVDGKSPFGAPARIQSEIALTSSVDKTGPPSGISPLATSV